MKSKIFIYLYALLCFCISLNRSVDRENKVFVHDKSGYHLYLPAIFVYHDLAQLEFYRKINAIYWPGGYLNWDWYGITVEPTGRKLNKYTAGTAVMSTPFFLLADAYTIITKQSPRDGYSLPYQWGAIASNIFWAAIGLFFLRGFLKRYYTDNVVLATLVSIALATNIYYYTGFDQGMSHLYSFTMIAAALLFTDKWYATQQQKYLLLLGIVMGMVAIIRPVNILFAIVPVFWNVANFSALKARFSFFREQLPKIIIALLLFTAIVGIQLVYWKYITGHWIVNSYSNEHFLFNEPRVFDGLFSYNNGWFVYTPIMFLTIPGFILLWKTQKQLVPVLLIFLAIMLYVMFSWWCWWYGGAFGARAMIDFLPVMAIPLAALYHYAFSKKLLIKSSMILCITCFCALNIFQTYQFILGILPYDHGTKAYYWRVFGKLHVEPDDRKLLMTADEFWEEWKRLDR